jgi:hypothetical protein
MVSRAVRWLVAALVTAVSFSVAAWVSGVFVLPPLMRSGADRWAVAAGLGVAVAAFAALWGQSWATRDGQAAATGDAAGAAAGPGVPAAGERSITAGGDISGIASTGDDTTSTQHR